MNLTLTVHLDVSSAIWDDQQVVDDIGRLKESGMRWLDVFSQTVELTEERWLHIVTEHPIMSEHREEIPRVLADPDYVKWSKRDKDVLLYYRYFADILDGKFLLVVVKKEEQRSFILTGYVTRSIMKGESLWERT